MCPRTSGHSTVSAFMFITYIQLANASLNVSSDALSARSPSTFVRSVSASSASSARAGSRNPRPCGASGCAPERERAKREPCETRRSGVRCGVGYGMAGTRIANSHETQCPGLGRFRVKVGKFKFTLFRPFSGCGSQFQLVSLEAYTNGPPVIPQFSIRRGRLPARGRRVT